MTKYMYFQAAMVCISCILIPLALYIWHRFLQPVFLKMWNPFSKVEDQVSLLENNTCYIFLIKIDTTILYNLCYQSKDVTSPSDHIQRPKGFINCHLVVNIERNKKTEPGVVVPAIRICAKSN